jgi:hypothetical protein
VGLSLLVFGGAQCRNERIHQPLVKRDPRRSSWPTR